MKILIFHIKLKGECKIIVMYDAEIFIESINAQSIKTYISIGPFHFELNPQVMCI